MKLINVLRSIDRYTGLYNCVRGLPTAGFDLKGEKELDWGWCLAHLPRSPRQRILDIGCAQSPIAPSAVVMGHEVTGVDTDRLPYDLPGFIFYRADFLGCDFRLAQFDIVVLCSVVEHVGLVGRYGQRDIPDGDLEAMRKAAALLKPGGSIILTIPVGRDMVFAPWHRIYGPERLPRLLEGFVVEKEHFLVKGPERLWCPTGRLEALRVDKNGLAYALGQFLLRLGADR